MSIYSRIFFTIFLNPSKAFDTILWITLHQSFFKFQEKFNDIEVKIPAWRKPDGQLCSNASREIKQLLRIADKLFCAFAANI